VKDRFLKIEIFRVLSKIQHYIKKLEAKEYYSKNNIVCLNIHKQFINALYDNVNEIKPKFYEQLLRYINYEYIQQLRYIQRSQTKEVPWSIIPNFEKIINNLLGDNYIFILRPQWKWNYKIITEHPSTSFNKIFYDLTKCKDKLRIEEETLVISFPVIEKTNFLFHTIIGHEIGHLFQKIYFKKFLTKEWEKETINKYLLLKLIRDEFVNVEQIDHYSDKLEHIISIYKGLVKEILPDIIGYFLLGPSMLFALYFFAKWNIDNVKPLPKRGNHYPPLKYRIRVLYDLFKESCKENQSKDFSLPEDFLVEIEDYLSDDADILIFRAFIYNYAYQLFTKYEYNIQHIINFSKEMLGDEIYRLDYGKLKYLINERIKKQIPPNEIDGNPVRLGDIFVSGWMYFYEKLIKEGEVDIERFIKEQIILDRLLLKASNLIYIHSYYLEKHVDA